MKRGIYLMVKKNKYRYDIQALRGIAVLLVILFHANDKYFGHGYLGVDIFFIISGFVVTPLISNIFKYRSKERFKMLLYFYQSRLYRLAPALAFTLVLSSVIIFISLNPSDHARFSSQGIATLLLLGNIGAYKYSGNYFSGNPNLLVHTWSLSVEEQIYFILPLLLLLLFHKKFFSKKIILRTYLFVTLVSLIFFIFPVILQPIYSKFGIHVASQISFYSSLTRIWQFTLGGIGYFLVNKLDLKFKLPKYFNFTLLLVFIWILFLPIQFFSSSSISPFFISVIVLLIIMFKTFEILPIFIYRKLIWLGDRSYSIYLLHMPLIYLAKYSKLVSIGSNNNRTIQVIIALIFTLIFGSLSYSQIENRFRINFVDQKFAIKSLLILLTLTFIIPFSLFLSIIVGTRHEYWGLNRNVPTPAIASTLDTNCARDSESGPPCIYLHSTAKVTALLIGDSHAGQLSQAFINATKKSNLNAVVWTHSGCPVQFQKSSTELLTDSCIRINLQMKDWVSKNKPSLIVISQFIKDDSNQEELRIALSELKFLVPNLLLIENNPIFPDGKDFMVSRPIFMKPYLPPTSYLKSLMDTRDIGASNNLAKWARDNGIETMNFESLFCNSELCNRFSQNGWLYRDRDHLSVEGANLTIPQLSRYMARL